tara:strand:+ start:1159 stop:1551 length:393 start_codon:yes stop_codon:yes gene_type:complete
LEGENLDLKNTISENAMQLMFELNGWTLSKPYVVDGIAYVKPDFYADNHVIGSSKKGYIYASGQTRVEYAGRVFSSVEELISTLGLGTLGHFSDWEFHEEKEWVITRDGQDFLFSFTTLDQLPNRKKVRC